MKTISVSKVISDTRPWQEQERLEAWKERVGEAEAKRISDEAKERGKKLDADFEQLTITGKCENKGLTEYLEPFTIKNRELPIKFEVAPGVILKGRIDALLERDGKSLIIDFKTASKPKQEKWISDYFLQLGAYYYLLKLKNPSTPFKIARIVCFVEGQEKPQVFRLNERQLTGYSEQFIQRLAQYIDENK